MQQEQQQHAGAGLCVWAAAAGAALQQKQLVSVAGQLSACRTQMQQVMRGVGWRRSLTRLLSRLSELDGRMRSPCFAIWCQNLYANWCLYSVGCGGTRLQAGVCKCFD